jgi:membrane protein DedA with SNARE-associated domain
MEQLSNYFLALVQHTGYAGLFLVMVLGNLAVPAGTEVLLPVVGALAATGHTYYAPLAILVALAGEVVGGALLWAVGRYGGIAFVHRFGRYVHLDDATLARIHAFYERFGARTVFICRFIPVVRGVAALPAGLSGMAITEFLGYTIAGSAIFCAALIGLGYMLGPQILTMKPLLHKAGFAVCGIAVIAMIAFALYRRNQTSTVVPTPTEVDA